MVYIANSIAMAAGDLTSTYFGRYITLNGVKSSYNQVSPPTPFRLKAASVWVSGDGHTINCNPNGIKLYIAIATTDVGKNIDLCQRHQRNHFHLTYVGDHRIEYAVIVGCVTSGCLAGDKLNFIVQIEPDDGKPAAPAGSGWCNYDGFVSGHGPPGELVLVNLSSPGVGADGVVSLQPAASGIVDTILSLHGYHDDNGGARNSYWSWYDARTAGGVSISFGAVAALVNYRRLSLTTVDGTTALSDGHAMNGLKYDRYCYPSFNVDAVGAGKKAHVRGIVLRTYGNES